MRGKVRLLYHRGEFFRITPAYAGKSTEILFTHGCHLGSPPPMRGKGNGKEIAHLLHGITPAYAGKSGFCNPCQNGSEDHPRLCGEKSIKSLQQTRTKGSPPPMRGKARNRSNTIVSSRITPAYAGKSKYLIGIRRWDKDHPRLCGEKIACS